MSARLVRPLGKIIPATDLKVGQIGLVATEGDLRDFVSVGDIVLRTYIGLICLSNPDKTWTRDYATPRFNVYLLEAGSEVVVTAA